MRFANVAVRADSAMPYGTAAFVSRFSDGTTQVAVNCGHDVRLALISRDGELIEVDGKRVKGPVA
jgi:hypothetical protein